MAMAVACPLRIAESAVSASSAVELKTNLSLEATTTTKQERTEASAGTEDAAECTNYLPSAEELIILKAMAKCTPTRLSLQVLTSLLEKHRDNYMVNIELPLLKASAFAPY